MKKIKNMFKQDKDKILIFLAGGVIGALAVVFCCG